MTNELLFFLQTILIAIFTMGALALGREALVGYISLLIVLANIFVIKQITLFGFHVTCADVYIIGAVLGSNLLQEYFGHAIAKKSILISFFLSFLAVAMAQLHLWYAPNAYDTTQLAYNTVLGLLPRVVVASFIANFCSQFLRLFLYRRLKKLCAGRYLVARNFSVTLVEQALDTALFGFIGLYGVVHALTDVFIISLMIKVIAIACSAPWVLLSKKIIKYSSKPLKPLYGATRLNSPGQAEGAALGKGEDETRI